MDYDAAIAQLEIVIDTRCLYMFRNKRHFFKFNYLTVLSVYMCESVWKIDVGLFCIICKSAWF